jgi:hypothetical protein
MRLMPVWRSLKACTDMGDLTHTTVWFAWTAVRQLNEATQRRLSEPDVCPGPDGHLLYTWDTDRHHVELEVFPTGVGEFFACTRPHGGDLWGADYRIGEPVPTGVLEHLRPFLCDPVL